MTLPSSKVIFQRINVASVRKRTRKVTQSRYKYYFCVEFLDGGKWKQLFPVLFSGNMAKLMNFMGLWIFPFKRGGKVSRRLRSGIAEALTYVNKHATCDFKISSPDRVSLL